MPTPIGDAWQDIWQDVWQDVWAGAGGGPSAPEITHSGSGTYGTATLGGATISRTFNIQNTGTAPLPIGTVTVPTGYTITTALPSSIAAGGNADLIVRLDTAVLGVKSGNISIDNGDSDENPYLIPVTGTVASASNTPPSGTILTPVDGQNITVVPYTITTALSDPDGSITQARLNVNGSFVDTVTIAPFSFTWNPGVGSYALYVEMTDDDGATANTPTINVTVSSPPPPPPPPAFTPGGSGRARLRPPQSRRRPRSRIVIINGLRFVRPINDDEGQ